MPDTNGIARVTSLQLFNFRCFQKCIIIPDDRPVILTGFNGSGKTSILEAISLCSPGKGIRNAHVDDISRKPDCIGWRVIVNLTTVDSQSLIEFNHRTGMQRRLNINDQSSRQLELANIVRVLWHSTLMDRLWVENADGRRKFLDRMVMSMVPNHPIIVSNYEKAVRERNRLLRDGIQDDVWFDSLERQLAQNGAIISTNRNLAIEHLDNSLQSSMTAFPKASLKIIQPDVLKGIDENKDALLSLFQSERQKDYIAGKTRYGPHRIDLSVMNPDNGRNAYVCSTGEQKALLLAIIMANARAVAHLTQTMPLLLLDEAVAHLDENLGNEFLEEIQTLGSQVWITATVSSEFRAHGNKFQHVFLGSPDTNAPNAYFQYSTTAKSADIT